MTEDCRNDCRERAPYVREIVNRPGLAHVDYRIGTYSSFLQAMLDDLNADPLLAGWTHRGGDDPGIALLEGAAVLGDILTFYQELYANEAYLRTAAWRESVADLVRLLGYRLAPGVGGRATLAFLVDGDAPVTVPAGFPVKAQLAEVEDPAVFETSREITAYPALGQFNLYRRRLPAQPVPAGLDRLEIAAVSGNDDPAGIEALTLEPGDRLLLLPEGVPAQTGGPGRAEIMIVDRVESLLDRTTVVFKGSLTSARGVSVAAYRIGRSFRHFGHNAPAQLTRLSAASTSVQERTTFVRRISSLSTPPPGSEDFFSSLAPEEMPLDQEVDDLAAGALIICQGIAREARFQGEAGELGAASFARIAFAASDLVPSTGNPFTLVREIRGVEPNSLAWGNLSGPATVVTLDERLATSTATSNVIADIRRLNFHEVTSPLLTLRAPAAFQGGALTEPTLAFFGTHADVTALAGRPLLLERSDGAAASVGGVAVTVTSAPQDFVLDGHDPARSVLWTVALDRIPAPFTQEDFAEEAPRVTAYGNLVEATQGETQRDEVLGNGDARQTFQTFKLPRSPLTYHMAAGSAPPETPELQVWVDGRLWRRVPIFFDQGPEDEVYIVREDDEGTSWVQFGDGKTGKRLPTGIGNVVARFRSGLGAYGPLKPGATVEPQGLLNRLDKVLMPQGASGGAGPEESGRRARGRPWQGPEPRPAGEPAGLRARGPRHLRRLALRCSLVADRRRPLGRHHRSHGDRAGDRDRRRARGNGGLQPLPWATALPRPDPPGGRAVGRAGSRSGL